MKAKRRRKTDPMETKRSRGRRRPWREVEEADSVQEIQLEDSEPREREVAC